MRGSVSAIAVLLGAAPFAAHPVAAQKPAGAPRIPVIANSRPLWKNDEVLQLGARPLLVIGTQSGESYEFTRIVGAARLSDGRIVVADASTPSLRFFDAAGTFLKSTGRKGEGPGELKEVNALTLLRGDTLVAGSFLGELSRYTGNGQYLGREGWATPPLALARSGMPVALASLDGSGRRVFAAMPRPTRRSSAAHWVDSFPVVIVDRQNALVRDLGKLPMMELAMDGDDARPPWFGAKVAYATDGRTFFVGYGGEYAIRAYSTSGELLRIINRAWRPVQVTKRDIDRYVVEWGKRWIKSTGADAVAEHEDLRNDPYAATVPAFSQLLVDRVGRLWVREAHVGDAPAAGQLNDTPLVPSTWSVFDDGGRWLGDVGMPASFQPTDIGADYVIGKSRNEDGLPTVTMYRLSAGRPAARTAPRGT